MEDLKNQNGLTPIPILSVFFKKYVDISTDVLTKMSHILLVSNF